MNPFPPDDIQLLTISALTRDIKSMLEVNYPQGVWVTGEVSNLSRPSSGHVYLKLKDAESQLNTVVYRGVELAVVGELDAERGALGMRTQAEIVAQLQRQQRN